MGRTVPQEQRGMDAVLPSCIVLVEGRAFKTDAPTKTGKHAYQARAEVIEPLELAGSALFEQFTIGSDEDPEALKPTTMLASFGMRQVTSLFADGLDMDIRGADEETFAEAYVGNRYMAAVQYQVEPALKKDGTPNEYAGNERNRVTRYFKPGEREPMILPVSGTGGTVQKASAAKAAAPAPKAAPTPPAAPKAAAPAPKAAPKAPSKANGPSPGATPGNIKCVMDGCAFTGTPHEFAAHVAQAHPEG